jgi:hypothetical protein
MAFPKKLHLGGQEMEKESVIAELHKMPGVSEKAAEGLYLLGIRSVTDLASQDPVDMYAKLKERKDFFAEPCMLNAFKIAVKFSQTKK